MEHNIPQSVFDNGRGRKLDVAEGLARYAKKGETHFHEVCHNPLTSLFITTGDVEEGETERREIHLKYVYQPQGYPLRINSYEDVMEKGYQLYLSKNDQETASFSGKYRTGYSCCEYKRKFREVSHVIERSIYTNHGIECYSDGNVDNRKYDNMFYMHVCDIFNIMVHECMERECHLRITTPSLSVIPEQMTHILQEKLLTQSQGFFLLKNIDIYYMAYGYHFNNSFIPMRTKMMTPSHLFSMSCFFMNDDFFLEHQKGKLMEINQNEKSNKTRMMYRTI
jgi:hypothetical protein